MKLSNYSQSFPSVHYSLLVFHDFMIEINLFNQSEPIKYSVLLLQNLYGLLNKLLWSGIFIIHSLFNPV